MGKKEINDILRSAINEFPILDVKVKLPEWVHVLSNKNEIKNHYLNKIKESVVNVNKIKDVDTIINYYTDSTIINRAYISDVDTGDGVVTLNLENANLRFLSSIVTSICAADFYKNVKNYFNLITIESFLYEVFLPLCDEYMANYYEKQKNANTLGR